jgi:NAD(P)H-flavin reductase
MLNLKKFRFSNIYNLLSNRLFRVSRCHFTNLKENFDSNEQNSERMIELKISFHSKIQLSKDGQVLRFLLPEQNSNLGIKSCQYINLSGNPIANEPMERPYHPISLDTDRGFLDILVKVYNKTPRERYGIFSNYLSNLSEGQVVTLKGPFGNLSYSAPGQFRIKKENSDIVKKVKKIGMIAGGSGIAPMFQLIQKVLATRNDNSALSLIYCTKTIEDITFGEDLIKLDRKGKISFYPTVENLEINNWAFGKGKVTEDMIHNYMPSPTDKEGVVLICGPTNMINSHTKPLLLSLGYKEENILTFE